MQTINVRELRNTIPHLRETLAQTHELVLVSNGEPVARILPMASPPRLEPMAWLRALSPAQETDSTILIREDRDRRGS